MQLPVPGGEEIEAPKAKVRKICPAQSKLKDSIVDFEAELKFLIGKRNPSDDDLKRIQTLKKMICMAAT